MKNETSSKRPSKSPSSQTKTIVSKKTVISKKQGVQQQAKITGPIMNSISKQNYDIMHKKFNITQIQPLEVKYVLRCIQGLFKDRFLYITTHKQGQILGSGQAKDEGLTLQIEGVGLAPKHCKFRFNGFKKFYIKDYGSSSGTWLKIPKQGIQIKDRDIYLVGPWLLKFNLSTQISQIQQLCQLYHHNDLCDTLLYNKITTVPQLYKASYNKFKQFPFSSSQISILNYICNQSKNWFNEEKDNKVIVVEFLSEAAKGFSLEVGWGVQRIYQKLQDTVLNDQNNTTHIAQIDKGMLVPKTRVFSKIEADKNYQLNLHDQVRIGDLTFELNRFNVGSGQNIGGRELMEDCYIFEEDVGGSQWKLISLFAVLDGYGGDECVLYVKNNLLKKIREWTPMLDEAGDLNQMIRLLMCKTFYELDYQFYQQHTDMASTCGTTILCLLIIDSKVYSFNLGDNRGLLYRDEQLFKLNIDHIPVIYWSIQSRVDEKARIQEAGGFVHYNRLNGKCTISRVLGQFEFKDINDYKNNMKGKLKSCLSCIPEVVCFDIVPASDEFILLSTDGIFDGLSLKGVVDFIVERISYLQKQDNPNKIVNTLMENCRITNPNCDNMAAILIFFKKGKIGNKNSF